MFKTLAEKSLTQPCKHHVNCSLDGWKSPALLAWRRPSKPSYTHPCM